MARGVAGEPVLGAGGAHRDADLRRPPVELRHLGRALEAQHPVLRHVLRPQGEVEAERHEAAQPPPLRPLRQVAEVISRALRTNVHMSEIRKLENRTSYLSRGLMNECIHIQFRYITRQQPT